MCPSPSQNVTKRHETSRNASNVAGREQNRRCHPMLSDSTGATGHLGQFIYPWTTAGQAGGAWGVPPCLAAETPIFPFKNACISAIFCKFLVIFCISCLLARKNFAIITVFSRFEVKVQCFQPISSQHSVFLGMCLWRFRPELSSPKQLWSSDHGSDDLLECRRPSILLTAGGESLQRPCVSRNQR